MTAVGGALATPAKNGHAKTAKGRNGHATELPVPQETPAQRLGLANPDQYVPDDLRLTAPKVPKLMAKLKLDIVEDTTTTLTKEMAKQYIDMPILEAERDAKDKDVQAILDAMLLGYFNPTNVTLASCEWQGKEWKVNGQHTAWAVYLHPDEDFSVPYVRKVKYRVNTRDQLEALYGTFDRGKPRSATHVVSTYVAGKLDVWPSLIPPLSQGMRHWQSPASHKYTMSAESLAALMRNEYPDLVVRVGKFIKAHYPAICRDKLRQKCIIAAMYETFGATPTKAAEFWTPVVTGLEMRSQTDPRKQLRDGLLRMNSQSRRSSKPPWTSEEWYRICVVAWNHWRDGKQVQSLRPTLKRVRAK